MICSTRRTDSYFNEIETTAIQVYGSVRNPKHLSSCARQVIAVDSLRRPVAPRDKAPRTAHSSWDVSLN